MTAHSQICEEMIGEPPHYFHSHRCNNKARWHVQIGDSGRTLLLCGVHVKRARRRSGWLIREIVR